MTHNPVGLGEEMTNDHVCGVDGWRFQVNPARVLCQRCLHEHPPIARHRLASGALWPDSHGEFVRVEAVLAAIEEMRQTWVGATDGDALACLAGLRDRIRGTGA